MIGRPLRPILSRNYCAASFAGGFSIRTCPPQPLPIYHVVVGAYLQVPAFAINILTSIYQQKPRPEVRRLRICNPPELITLVFIFAESFPRLLWIQSLSRARRCLGIAIGPSKAQNGFGLFSYNLLILGKCLWYAISFI